MESTPPNTLDVSTSSSLATSTDVVGTSESHSEIEQTSASMPPSGSGPSASVDVETAPQQVASTSVTKGDELASLALDPHDDMLAQLQREMEKRRPDRFLIGVLCRSLGGVPCEYRTKIWKELLGVARNERLHLDQSILEVEEDLVNQRVVAADASRTRGNDALFKLPATQETIGKILTFYCKSRSIRYKQGMNEVLAPFLLLEQPRLPEGVVYQLFYAMIDKFLPHVFVDRDFKSLQCSFQLFRLLMLYHDPKLCNYLDQHAMTPELYVTPWFMTLFARGLSQELVLSLWDFFLLHDDPYLLHYVAYALVETHRDAILQADVAMLPQVLTGISLDSRERVEDVCAAALELMETTPRSYRRDLYSVCYGGYTNAMVPFLRQLMGASSMQVYPDELLSNLLSRLGQSQGLNASPAAIAAMGPPLPELVPQKSYSAERDASLASVFFIVLDCRPLEQYKACHLSLSYHVDPDIVGSPDALSVLLKGFTRMKGCHFCFVGPTVAAETKQSGGLGFEAINRITRGLSGEKAQIDAAAAAAAALSSNSSLLGVGTNTVPFLKKEHITVTRLVLMFLQKGFEHVSRLDGGFEELKLEIEKLDQFAQDQLLVYEEVTAVEAPTAAPLSTEKLATGGLKSFAKKALDRVRTLSDDDATSAIVNSDAGVAIKTKTKATVTTISQRLQILTSAAKDAVASSTAGKVLQSPPPPSSVFKSVVTDERGLVGEEEWMEVYTRTREALEKSLRMKEVVFQTGSLGILFQRSRHKRYLTVVDSLVPESQASESQQVEPGDLLVAVNGEDIAGVPFQDVIDMIKDARRPLVLRLQNVSKKSLDTFDAISIPPLPPILISASHHSLCLSWNKLSLPDERYQLQYAKQSDYNFNPWVSVPMKHPDQSTSATPLGIDRTSGITSHHNGTLVGLEPGVSLVFRVRCGNKEKWGPYSLSSSPMTTLEKGEEEETPTTISATEASATSPTAVKSPRVRTSSSSSINSSAAVFLPGECPEFFERGTFYFRVVAGLRARATPAFDGEKLDIILEKGTIIKCSERLVVSSTNQIFVRLCPDWNVAAQRKQKTVGKKKDSGDDDRRSISASASVSEDADEFQAWAFENTPEGACVLERIPEFTDDMLPAAAVPLQEQAKSLVSSFLSASGLKTPTSGGTSTSSTTSSSSAATASPSSTPTPLAIATAPRIIGVAAASSSEIKVTWEPVTDLPSRITRYQIQYAKNRLTASWVTLKQDLSAETCTYTLSELVPNVAYVFRVRAADAHNQWGPFSETSEPCKTMEEAVVVVAANKPTKEEPPTDEATTPRGIPPARDEAEMIENATAQERTSSTGFSSFFVRSTSSSTITNSASRQASQPLRTGSTLLDKAVAAASKLTLTRSDSGRRRRSSAAVPPPTVEEMLETVLPTEGDLVEVDTWKQAVSNVDASSRSFSSVRYIPTIVVVASSTEPSSSAASSSAKDIDPFAAIATSKAVAIDSVDPSVLESSSSQLTWNRVGDRELVVTRTALIALAKPSSHADAPDAVVETRRSLSALAKITSKKTVPNSVVFHFKREQLTNMEKVAREAGDEDDVAPLEQLCFVVEDKAACVALVKENYSPDDSA